MHRPNIVVITTDQQHWKMMSCAGEQFIQTPACDRLAAEGIRFDKCYTTNPLCVPARYSFISGYMPHQFGDMEDNYQSKDRVAGTPKVHDWIQTPTLGALLQADGYETAYGGKWHIEGPYGLTQEMADKFSFRYLSGDIREDGAVACADFIREQHDRPFFLWASFDQPHDICKFLPQMKNGAAPSIDVDVGLPANHAPTECESSWIEGLRKGTLGDEASFELGLNRRYGLEASQWDAQTWQQYRNTYRYYMQEADRYIQLILDAIDERGLLENTVVIFTSDHGDHDGAHQMTMKRTFYEESVHVPFIIRLPDGQGAGTIDNEHLICNGLDLVPTVCDFADVPTPDTLPGSSVKQLCAGSTNSWRNYTVAQTRGGRMICSPRYKYNLYVFGEAEEELYDLEADPGECVNRAADNDMRTLLDEHRHLLKTWVAENADTRGQHYCQLAGTRPH